MKALSTLFVAVLAVGLMGSLPAQGQTTTYARGGIGAVEGGTPALAAPNASASQSLQRDAGAAGRVPSAEEVPALGRAVAVRLDGTSLEHALRRIAAKAGLKLAYLQESVAARGTVTLEAESVSVREAFLAALRGTDLRLESASEDQLVLTSQPTLRKARVHGLGATEPVQAAGLAPPRPPRRKQGTITGTITDGATGQPLPGVNVLVEGTDFGAATGPKGIYEITGIEPGTYAVTASFIGYGDETEEGVEVQEGQTTTVDITMQQAATGLDEVVVVGYGQEQRQDLTGSVSSVGAAQIEEGESTSLDQALQGRVAGMRIVQSNGAPGAEPVVRIRGRNSILGNSQPLYVVDGVPIGRGGGGSGNSNPLATINPEDIESVEVLKDASATAIYGARGSNGVIVITTKGGEGGRRRVNFGATVGASNMKKIDPMNASQYVEMANDRAINGGLSEPFPNGVPDDAVDTNWLDEVTHTGVTQEYNMSVSGGDDDGTYRVSGNYLSEQGTVLNSRLKRGSFRVNLQQDIGGFSITPRLSVSRVWQDERGGGVDQRDIFEAPPLFGPYQGDGSYTTFAQLSGFPFSPPTHNPYAATQLGLNETTRDRILGNVAIDYELTEGLTAQVRGGTDITRTQNDDYTPVSDALNSTINSASEGWYVDTRWLAEGQLTFDRTVATNHDLSATAVATWEREQNESLYGSAQQFVSDALVNNNLGAGDSPGVPSNNTVESTLVSYVGRVNYSFMNRYLLTLTGRLDGSSVFGAENKWGTFPSAALAWRASEEDFFQNIDPISNLKLRVSWGLSGNQAIGPYQTLVSYNPTDVAFNRTRQVGLYITGIPNPDLQWETTEQFNIGLDAGLFGQRYTFGIDVYNKVTRNLLANVPLAPSSGFGSTLRNIGRIQNRGVEFQFDAAILTGDFGWSMGGNVSANRNEVKELARGSDITSGVGLYGAQSIAREGESIGSFYGLQLADPPLTEDGYFNYVDRNEDGAINSDDRTIIGNPYPDFTYGMNTELRYRGFRLSAFVQGEQGKEIFSFAKDLIGDSMHRGRNQVAEVFDNRWTRENQNRYAEYPASVPNLNKDASEWQVENASYLRIKNVRLGYSLPAERLGLPIESANVFVSGQNLATFTPYEFFSPDSQSYSGNSLNIGVHGIIGYYPFSRTYTFGINLGF